jgi:hypothetical protein
MSATTALRSLILSQPDGSPIRLAYAAGNDVRVSHLLHQPANPDAKVFRNVPIAEFFAAIEEAGLRPAIESVAASSQMPQPLVNTCKRLLRIELSPHFTVIYGGDAKTAMQAFVATGNAQQSQVQPLLSMIEEPDLTPIATATPDDVYNCRLTDERITTNPDSATIGVIT